MGTYSWGLLIAIGHLYCPCLGKASIWATDNHLIVLLSQNLLTLRKHISKISKFPQVREVTQMLSGGISETFTAPWQQTRQHYSTYREFKWQRQECDHPFTSSYSPGSCVITKCHYKFSMCIWRAKDKWHSAWNTFESQILKLFAANYN